MVNLKKQVDTSEKISAEIDFDAFIQEMKDLKNKSRPVENKTDDDFIFKILMYLLWAELGFFIGLDIFLIIDNFL